MNLNLCGVYTIITHQACGRASIKLFLLEDVFTFIVLFSGSN